MDGRTRDVQHGHSRGQSLDEPSPEPIPQRGRAREKPTGVSLAGMYGDDEQGKFGATCCLAPFAGGRELWVL